MKRDLVGVGGEWRMRTKGRREWRRQGNGISDGRRKTNQQLVSVLASPQTSGTKRRAMT